MQIPSIPLKWYEFWATKAQASRPTNWLHLRRVTNWKESHHLNINRKRLVGCWFKHELNLIWLPIWIFFFFCYSMKYWRNSSIMVIVCQQLIKNFWIKWIIQPLIWTWKDVKMDFDHSIAIIAVYDWPKKNTILFFIISLYSSFFSLLLRFCTVKVVFMHCNWVTLKSI